MGHSDEDDVEHQPLILANADSTATHSDTRTPLDKTIDRIGMGPYQWMLLSLCGFGWMADNMWIQAIAIILPRVQQHFQVPDNQIGIVSSSMFAGMMLGAVGWGTYSDVLGRSAAFNATLFFTSLFGVLASLANSFVALCLLLFLLGSAVGGSMPTDGTLILEHMPRGKQYLVTALSVFFSLGAVVSSLLALLVLPSRSCPPGTGGCNVHAQNQGWKVLLITLALVTLSMFLGRIAFFRLHESPRYLVHAGRPHDALVSLQMISRFNGSDLDINIDDVHDHPPTTITNGEPEQHRIPTSPPRNPSSEPLLPQTAPAPPPPSPPPPPPVNRRSFSSAKRLTAELKSVMPRWITRPVLAWADRMSIVLSPPWFRTTVLVSSSWCAIALAYTMFNVFLPKLLETEREGNKVELRETLWGIVIYTLGGCPGALVGAWLVETRIGKRWALAGSTFLTALLCAAFVHARSPLAVRLSTVGISLTSTTMWAVLYGWTPEIFGTKVRGTACGLASALSRIGGMVAPLIGGVLLNVDRSVPVYTSAGVFTLAGVCVLLLKEKR